MRLGLFVLTLVNAKERDRRPNIVFILTDDLGWSDVSWNNRNVHSTPFLYAMSKNGTILTQSYSTHRCTPTRASFLTGRYPWRYGLGTDPIDGNAPEGLGLNEKLLPEYLKESGYSTHIVGKWHLGNCNSSYLPQNRGFDSFYGHIGGIIDYSFHKRNVGNNRYLDYFHNDIPLPEKNGVYSTFDFGRESREIFTRVDDPKFIYLSFNAPHGPISAPDVLIEEMRLLHPKTSESRLTYLAAVKAVDMEVERLYQTITNKDETRDTIIIFQSDNGATLFGNVKRGSDDADRERQGCNYPYRGQKTLLTEGGTLAPSLVYSVQGRLPQRVVNGLFHVTDWFPTILRMSKASKATLKGIKQHIDGINQNHLFVRSKRHANSKRTKMIYGMLNKFEDDGTWSTKFAMRIGNYKFYNYKFETPTMRCEEGFHNLRLKHKLINQHGFDHYRKIMTDLNNQTTTEYQHRNVITEGISIFNLSSDPFELYDLTIDNPSALDDLNKILQTSTNSAKPLIENNGSNVIAQEMQAGYQMPLTGAKANFWPKLYRFVDNNRLLTFLKTSGRVNNNVVGTDFCQSPEDQELLIEVASGVQLKSVAVKQRSWQRKNDRERVQIARDMILRQYPNLHLTIDS